MNTEELEEHLKLTLLAVTCTPKEKKIFNMLFYEECSVTEVAKRLRTSHQYISETKRHLIQKYHLDIPGFRQFVKGS